MSSDENTNSGGIVLLSTEVELYVQALQAFPIEELGSKKWSSQREMLEKLNMQAILSATQNENEYVKESFVTYEKVCIPV
jgi:zinc finger MYND domain-containing protein 10